jgi:hypothetical protein
MTSTKYDSVVAIGDRVALAPHLDLWMAGVRFGNVVDTFTWNPRPGKIRHGFKVKCDDGRIHAFTSDSILGAVR